MTPNTTPRTPLLRRRHLRRHGRPSRSGFTMVEMLTVIGIIVVLMAILLPTVGKVRQQAYVASTRAEMAQISQAIESYYNEYKAYPGPVSNTALTNGTTYSGIGPVTSTENLTLGLCGGLVFSGGTVIYNPNDIANNMGPANLSPNPMLQTRHTPFMPATPNDNMANVPWDPTNGKSGGFDSTIPEFLDRFPARFGNGPRPILYIRATRGNPAQASNGEICGPSDVGTASGQYNYTQLQRYALTGGLNLDFNTKSGGLATTTAPNPPSVYPMDTQGNQLSDSPYFGSWSLYLGNAGSIASNGKPTLPRGKDSYILISAGLDGIFGTTDDLFHPQ